MRSRLGEEVIAGNYRAVKINDATTTARLDAMGFGLAVLRLSPCAAYSKILFSPISI